MQLIRYSSEQGSRGEPPLFVGEVHRLPLAGPAQSGELNVSLVRFGTGGRNAFHTHTFDQFLYVTEGEGIIAVRDDEQIIRPGDLVVIPAGEAHWHGATDSSTMSHLAIGRPGSTQVVPSS